MTAKKSSNGKVIRDRYYAAVMNIDALHQRQQCFPIQSVERQELSDILQAHGFTASALLNQLVQLAAFVREPAVRLSLQTEYGIPEKDEDNRERRQDERGACEP